MSPSPRKRKVVETTDEQNEAVMEDLTTIVITSAQLPEPGDEGQGGDEQPDPQTIAKQEAGEVVLGSPLPEPVLPEGPRKPTASTVIIERDEIVDGIRYKVTPTGRFQYAGQVSVPPTES